MRRREALVCDTPQGHMTRDVREGVCSFFGLRFRVFDTAGLEPGTSASHQGHGGSGRESGGGSRAVGFIPSLLGNLPEADRAAMEASILQRTAEITSYLLGQAAAVLFLVDARWVGVCTVSCSDTMQQDPSIVCSFILCPAFPLSPFFQCTPPLPLPSTPTRPPLHHPQIPPLPSSPPFPSLVHFSAASFLIFHSLALFPFPQALLLQCSLILLFLFHSHPAPPSLAPSLASPSPLPFSHPPSFIGTPFLRAGIQPADVEVADWLRRSVPKHRVVLLANKCEGLGGDSTGLLASHVAEAYSMGFGDPIPISAESGEGLEDLYAAVKGPVEEREREGSEEREERQREMRERREDMEGRKMAVSGMSQRTEGAGDFAALPDSSECSDAALYDDAAYAAGALDITTLPAAEEEEVEEEDDDEAAAQALLSSSAAAAEAAEAAETSEIPLQLAIAGLPNVGKSTLVNSLLGAQRVLTGPEPGLTRDAVRIGITYQGKPMWLVDTAGWVKAAQARQKGPVSLARMDMERSIGRAHVVVLVLDAAVVLVLDAAVVSRCSGCSAVQQQHPSLTSCTGNFMGCVAEEEKSLKTAERSLARWVWEEGRALVVAANKMDAVGGDRDKRWVRKKVRRAVPVEIAALLPQVHNVPIVFTSALHGEGGKELMQAVSDAYDRWNTMLHAARLKHWLPQTLRKLPGSCTAASVKSIVQVKSRPPTFVVRVTAAAAGDRSLARFFSTRLAADFGFDGVPVRVVLRTKDGTRW
ncbi:unnamed protein product [Closterium sp. Naga37s-1]|nr:unnamed protein product [Closterium sp. Naga37s-1]